MIVVHVMIGVGMIVGVQRTKIMTDPDPVAAMIQDGGTIMVVLVGTMVEAVVAMKITVAAAGGEGEAAMMTTDAELVGYEPRNIGPGTNGAGLALRYLSGGYR